MAKAKNTKKLEIRTIDIMSAGKVLAAIYAICGFFIGLLVAAGIGGMMAWMPMFGMMNVGYFGGALAVAAIIFGPIIGAIYGFVFGVALAFIYNIVAERIGGIVIQTK